eukprot:CAMPEP_0170240492 /NCGR_PEP_ID=MMETSP0116_2-20130129/20004_1 /TAXON_ID=400756 /ORGANISM="Durinskia baltica, Strain CSIRO CS-38" /LENGTH=262 /DNA_ID=CAMNT_0010491311 /DNA_START=72 /DNA_END=857 /DNA_ORIENTATION=+
MAEHVTHEDMLAYTAQLRAQASAKEKLHIQQELGPRTTDMTLAEVLDEAITTMQSDKFWIDLAKPLAAARQALSGAGTPGALPPAPTAARMRAAELLRGCTKQIVELKHYFHTELQALESAAAMLEDESREVSLDSLVDGVKTTRSPETEAALAKGLDETSREDKAMKAAEGPWEFIETQDKTEVTVHVPVPEGTGKADVKVVFRERSLTVRVAGHAMQPAVIDGELTGKVDPDSCGWTLEGSGASRRLALEMEKTMGGIMW